MGWKTIFLTNLIKPAIGQTRQACVTKGKNVPELTRIVGGGVVGCVGVEVVGGGDGDDGAVATMVPCHCVGWVGVGI